MWKTIPVIPKVQQEFPSVSLFYFCFLTFLIWKKNERMKAWCQLGHQDYPIQSFIDNHTDIYRTALSSFYSGIILTAYSNLNMLHSTIKHLLNPYFVCNE